MPTVSEKRRAFRALHESGCFVLPNPYDVGTARYLQHMGFKALATTSSGAAFSRGLPDQALSLEDTLAHIGDIAGGVDVPVNADFGDGFAREPNAVADNVRRCLDAGVAALSIEDQVPGTETLYEPDLAVARIAAARKAVDAGGGEAMLVARTEAFMVGHPAARDEALRRLTQFATDGADVLYAPGVRTRDDIAVIVAAVAPKPVNVLIGWPDELSVADIAALGVRRVSVGGALAKAAWARFVRAATAIRDTGRFDVFADNRDAGDLDTFFREDARRRHA